MPGNNNNNNNAALKNEEPLLVLVLGCCYLATTVVSFIALCGNQWVSYDRGYSGLWDHCNTTDKPQPKEDCDHIDIGEAPGSLHGIRASFIIGIIIWCLGAIQRIIKWQLRGERDDRIIIAAAFTASALFLTSSLLFTLVYYDEVFPKDPSKFVNPHLSQNHSLGYTGSGMALIVGILSVIHHLQLNKSIIISYLSCKTCPSVCQKRVSPPETPAQRQTTAGRRGRNAASTAAANRTTIVTVTTGATQNATTTSGTTRASGATSSDVMALPPSYDDVIGDQPGPNVTVSLPNGASADRELVLSPPPAYAEKV